MTVPLDASVLSAVRVLGDYGDAALGQSWSSTAPSCRPPPICAREFRLDKPRGPRHALRHRPGPRGHATSTAGASAMTYFTPGWTDYKKRVYYRTYDVTKLVRRGRLTPLGAVLADGWFSGYVGFRGDRDLYGKYPRVRAQLHLEFADGSTADVATGPGWKAATGPVLEADFLKGETYDARLERPGWDEAGLRRCPLGCRGCRQRRSPSAGAGASRPARARHPGIPRRGRSPSPSRACSCSTWARTSPACRA